MKRDLEATGLAAGNACARNQKISVQAATGVCTELELEEWWK